MLFPKKIFVFLYFQLLFFEFNVSASRILVLSFFATKSHKIAYMPILNELGKRGHNITIFTPIPPLSPTPNENIHEQVLIEWAEMEKSILKVFNPLENAKSGKTANTFAMFPALLEICRKSYDLPQIQQLIQNPNQFDLVFFNPVFNECALGIIHLLQIPMILWCPLAINGYFASFVGGHFPPSFNPQMAMSYPDEMTYFQRFLNFGYNAASEFGVRNFYAPKMEAIYREKLANSTIPSARFIMASQTALVLANGHFSVHKPRALSQDIIEVGGIHCKPAKPLPDNLEQFIRKGKQHGFIYFSLGSALKASDMSASMRKIFLQVFGQLQQQVLIKWETETMEGEIIPENVMLSKWLPQQDLLGHESIRLFITHCGGGSLEEAIYHACPLLGIPIFGDQLHNAKLAEEHVISVNLAWNLITQENLLNAIVELLYNSTYKQNVQKLSKIFKDQPVPPLETAVYWIEYAIRHKGAPHLRSISRKLNFFVYHSYDVILAYLVLIIATSYLVVCVVKYLLYKICNVSIQKRKLKKN